MQEGQKWEYEPRPPALYFAEEVLEYRKEKEESGAKDSQFYEIGPDRRFAHVYGASFCFLYAVISSLAVLKSIFSLTARRLMVAM